MKYLLIFLLISQNVFAYDVKYIQQNDPAPYTGYIMTPETEKQFRLMDTELNYQTQLNTTLDKINKTYQDTTIIMQNRIDNQQKNIDSLTSQLSKDDSFWGKLGMFLLGAATTTLITFGVSRAIK